MKMEYNTSNICSSTTIYTDIVHNTYLDYLMMKSPHNVIVKFVHECSRLVKITIEHTLRTSSQAFMYILIKVAYELSSGMVSLTRSFYFVNEPSRTRLKLNKRGLENRVKPEPISSHIQHELQPDFNGSIVWRKKPEDLRASEMQSFYNLVLQPESVIERRGIWDSKQCSPNANHPLFSIPHVLRTPNRPHRQA